MSTWLKAAEGTSFENLAQVIADRELPVGTKLQCVMNCGSWEWLFDVAGAEMLFQAQCPDSVRVIDVYGQYGQGIVDMEVVSTGTSSQITGNISLLPALGAIIAWIGAHWLAIVITTVVIATIISLIVIFIKIPAILAIPAVAVFGAALGIAGLLIYGMKKGYTVKKGGT